MAIANSTMRGGATWRSLLMNWWRSMDDNGGRGDARRAARNAFCDLGKEQAMDKRQKVIAGLRDAIAFAKGDKSRARVTLYDVPQSIDVKKLRERLGMSQPEFALKFGFSLGTLRQWEQGRRSPDGPARVLLTVISHSPTTVKNALEKEARRLAP